MTVAYNIYFVCVWGSIVLAVPLAITTLLLGVTSVDSTAAVVWGVATSVVVTYTLLMRLHTVKVLVRAGAWPACCAGDLFPRTERELVDGIADIVSRTGNAPEIVGSGWGFFLKRRGPRGPRVFMHTFSGKLPSAPGALTRWAAGTTVEHVSRYAEQFNLSFETMPTMSYISLGSWFSHGSHGNGGDLARGSSFTMARARVLDMLSGEITTMKYSEVRKTLDTEPNMHCVIDVKLQFVRNDILQKEGMRVDSPQTAANWLMPGAQLRVLFLGAARSYAMGVRWSKPPLAKPADHPHFCSRFCTWLQADVCSSVCGCSESASRWGGFVSYANANRWMPSLPPLSLLLLMFTRATNFEVIFTLGRTMDGDLLHSLISRLQSDVHSKVGGRSEIRYGRPGPNTPVFLDFSLHRDFHHVFRMLYARFGVTTVALHPGKFDSLCTEPCNRVSLSHVYRIDHKP